MLIVREKNYDISGKRYIRCESGMQLNYVNSPFNIKFK